MIQKKIRNLICAGLGLVLCVLLCGGIGMTSQAAETKTYGDFTYEEGKDGITITEYTGNKKKVAIPDKINEIEVTGIGTWAFRGSSLTCITIPERVTKIEDYAFWDCGSLTDITLPESLTSIGSWAFSGCSSLTDITLPESLTSIGSDAFSYCSSLTDITLPESLTSIGATAFLNCSSLTSITIPKNVRSMGYGVFKNCERLKKVTLPEGITRIASEAFSGCSSLTSLTIPDSVTSIGRSVVWDCNKLTSVVVPDSVTEFDTLKEPGFYVAAPSFWGAPNVTIICNKNSAAYKYAKKNNIPVKLMPKPAKKGTILTVSSKKIKVKVTSSSKKNPTVAVMKITNKKTKKLTIPSTVKVGGVTYKVTAVASQAFKGNKNLTNVTIGKGITKIGNEAFAGCKNLKKIIVTAGNLTTIRKNAFKGINKNVTITVKGTKKAKTALIKKLKKSSIGYVKTWKIK